MKAIYKHLLDNSIAAALSAIEIYNKPDFRYRNEIFVILIVNSWELLLKAKIIKDTKKINSIYSYDGIHIKKNRNNSPLTLELVGAMRKLSIREALEDNLLKMIEIRDTAIHFYNRESTQYLIYSLGAASLKNYQKLVNDWFGRNLLEYNFYILPLGFAYNFKSFSTIDLGKEPELIRNLISDITAKQISNNATKDGFYLVCEIETKMISAKKLADPAGITVKIDQNDKDAKVAYIKKENLIDQYTLSYKELKERIKKTVSSEKMRGMDSLIKKQKIKYNPKYSVFNFRTKSQSEAYSRSGILPKSITSIYNDECVEYISNNL